MEDDIEEWHPITEIGSVRGIVIGVWRRGNKQGAIKALLLDQNGVWHEVDFNSGQGDFSGFFPSPCLTPP